MFLLMNGLILSLLNRLLNGDNNCQQALYFTTEIATQIVISLENPYGKSNYSQQPSVSVDLFESLLAFKHEEEVAEFMGGGWCHFRATTDPLMNRSFEVNLFNDSGEPVH